ncbi:hypothetical protein ACINB_30760 [Acidovorax sp. NB1]|nr:hypothetical protein ACINB_30760 [Acidovorax sp. NB1]
MTDVNSSIRENAIRCLDLLHRLLGVWLVLCLIAAYLPTASNGAQLRLPFTDVNVPVNSARWTCAVAIFVVGVVGCVMLRQVRDLCAYLSSTEHVAVVLTYPSIATLGSPRQRMLFGQALAGIQYFVGIQLWSPMPRMFGGAPDIGLAFLYAVPMFWFAWDLRDWQKSLSPEIKLPKITGAGE